MEYKILGVNRRYYPNCDYPAVEGAEITAVLVAGEIGDYTCYVGMGLPENVARWGNKLSFAEARVQFPTIEERKYRL